MARSSSTHLSFSCVVATVVALIVFGFQGITTCGATRILVHKKASTNFIATKCGNTDYPQLCVDSLSAHASTIQDNPSQLAQTAVSVCLADARSTSAVLSTLSTTGGIGVKEAGVVGDCTITMGDSVDKLQKSLEAMGNSSGKKGNSLRINDVQTWVSAALTDVTTCQEVLDGSNNTDGGVKTRLVNVERLASIALALINALSSSSP